MRIAIIAPNDLRIYDGTTIRITGQIKSIASFMERIFLVSRSLNKELLKLNNLSWIKLKHFRYLTNLGACYADLFLGSFVCSAIRAFFSIKELEDVDVIHAHWTLTLPIARVLKKYEIPLIIDLHGLFELNIQDFLHSPVDWLITQLNSVIEKNYIYDESIDAFIVPSFELKEYMTVRFNIPSEKIHVVPDGIDLDLPQFSNDLVESLRRELGVESNFIVTYVGTPSYFHGFYDLLKAFRLVKGHISNAVLLLIVPSKSKVLNELKSLGSIAKNVIVLESIPRKELYKYLYASHVLVLPHRAGTQFDFLPSNKLLDYIASGKPIVSYSLKPVARLLSLYPYKYLAEPNNPYDLAQGIIKFYPIGDIHIDGRAYVRDYDWRVIGSKLMDTYRKILLSKFH